MGSLKTIGNLMYLIPCFIILRLPTYSQNCIPTTFNNKKILTCNQNCKNIQLDVPNLKSTSNYIVKSISYNPYPFTTIIGNTNSTFYNLGSYSTSFNFSFPFCFYDSVFTNAVLSPYGLLTFDTIPGCYDSPNSQSPIPIASGLSCQEAGYYPRSTIFGCYTRLDPSLSTTFHVVVSPSDRKIEWRVEGTAPCRRLVVSYYHIGSGANPTCSLINPATFQMVMYESSSLIDIYFENYSCPELYDNGKTICGIQNWERDKGVAALGKNATVWTAHNEGYRFTPSGGASRFASSKLYSLSGSFITNADTATNTNDSSLLKLIFTNICSISDTTKYIVETSFTTCPNGNLITSTDTVIVIKKHLNPTIINLGSGNLSTTNFNSYQWLLNSNPISNATSQNFSATQTGNYQVIVTDSLGCRDTSLPFSYTITPITLINFTAYYNNKNANIIKWQTTQELNSKNFEIQKSYSSQNFNTLKIMVAAGNSNTLLNYNYTDNNILFKPTFYRLKSTDLDGQFTYSKIVVVNPIKSIFEISNIYPNPANDHLIIEFNSIVSSPITMIITDILGRVVQKNILYPAVGFNKTELHVSSLSKGKYYLKLISSNDIVKGLFSKY